MKVRKYYSTRVGKQNTEVALSTLRDLFFSTFNDLDERRYFDEYFGHYCVDGGQDRIEGKIPNISNYILRKVRKNNLWPISEKYTQYSEEDLFDTVEFLFDHVSTPLEEDAWYHSYGECGYHYKNFDKLTGQAEFMAEVNEYLADYMEGYRLDVSGEIFSDKKSERTLKPLLEAELTNYDPENIENRMQEAVGKFKRYKSTIEDRKEAVRTLADCLEFIRPKLKTILDRKDESDLFTIANNFSIRHHNPNQKTNYDQNIWLSWMFYFYLATLHASLRLLEKNRDIK